MLKFYFLLSQTNVENFKNILGKIIPYEVTKQFSSISSKEDISQIVLTYEINSILENLIENITNVDISKIIIFYDDSIKEEILNSLNTYKQSIFLTKLNLNFHDQSNVNMLKQQITKGIKRINYLSKMFEDSQLLPIMRMPRQNFQSSILSQLYDEIEKNTSSTDEIEKLLVKFIDIHKKPKRRTKNKKIKFFEDGRRLYYKLEQPSMGHTGHGTNIPEIIEPPHNICCLLNSVFRFGIRIDHTIHFDVSKEDKEKISESLCFYNCHGDKVKFKDKTHLNIFSNDFIRST